jgi:hypothetical protein
VCAFRRLDMRVKNVLFPAAKTFPVAARSLATGYSL